MACGLFATLAITALDAELIMEDRFRVHTLDSLAIRTAPHHPPKDLLQKVGYAKTDGNSISHGKLNPQGNDQGSTHNDYFVAYERAFIGLPRDLTMLNIGILAGHSLRIYAKFFGSAATVVGCDVNLGLWQDSLTRGVPTPSNIEVVNGSSWDASTANALRRIYGRFELIVDDGCHEVECTQKTFVNLFPLLRPGGIYIVEDAAPLPMMLELLQTIQKDPRSLKDKDARLRAAGAGLDSQVESVTFGNNFIIIIDHHQAPVAKGPQGTADLARFSDVIACTI